MAAAPGRSPMNRACAAVLVLGLAACATPEGGGTTAAPPAAPGPAAAPTRPAPAATPAAPARSRGAAPATPPGDPGFWTAAEMALLDQGLDVLNVSRADLGFQKRPLEDPFRLAVVNRALDEPLTVGVEAQAWDEVAKGGDPAAILARAEKALDADVEILELPAGGEAAIPHVGDGAACAVADLCHACDLTGDYLAGLRIPPRTPDGRPS